MSEIEVVVEATSQAVCHRAAMIWQQICEYAVAERGRFRVALSGGSTPRQLYEIMVSDEFCTQMDWTKVQFFFGDERSVSPDHVDSNYRMAREAILDPLSIDEHQIFRMRGESDDLDAAAATYEQQMRESFGLERESGFPAFDLMLLGMGPDGHTASLFPHTDAIRERSRWVVSNDVPQLGTRRMTLTVPVINTAQQILFMVAGESKADALREVLSGAHNPEKFPSQYIKPDRGQLTFLVDEAAAAKLPQPEAE